MGNEPSKRIVRHVCKHCGRKTCSCTSVLIADLTEENSTLQADLATARADSARLDDVLGYNAPWPLAGTLTRLIQEVSHLWADHNCDCNGYEIGMAARDQAKILLEIIERPRKAARAAEAKADG